MDPLSPGDRFFPDRVVPEPIMAAVSGEFVGDHGGGGGVSEMECGYRNGTDRMVILRCLGPNAFFLERVVFPFELLSFLCPPESEVEILTHGLGGPELLESMPARLLRLDPSLSAIEVAPEGDDAPGPWLQAG